MIVYKGRRFAVRRYEYGGSGIVDMVGSLLARYATTAMLTTAAKEALRGTLVVAKKAILHVIAHKLATTIVRKQERVDCVTDVKDVTGSQEPQLKKASVDTDGIDINARIDGSGPIRVVRTRFLLDMQFSGNVQRHFRLSLKQHFNQDFMIRF